MSRIGRIRTCSCCSRSYKEWKEQDIEGKYCQKCTIWMLRKAVTEHWRVCELVASRLNEKNKANFLSRPMRQKRIIIDKLHQKGILTWTINGR